MILGNIFSDSKSLKVPPHLHLCSDWGSVDRTLPTLIVGLENARDHIEGFNILHKVYTEQNLWWTFKLRERRDEFEMDMADFSLMCVRRITQDIEYQYINILSIFYSSAKRWISYLNDQSDKYIYNDRNRFLFIYDNSASIVFGLSLSALDFIGIPREKALKKLYSNPHNHKVGNFDKIPKATRQMIGKDFVSLLVLNTFS